MTAAPLLTTIDDLWSEYLASVADLKSDIVWTSLSFREPLYEYMKGVDTNYRAMEDRGELSQITNVDDLNRHVQRWRDDETHAAPIG